MAPEVVMPAPPNPTPDRAIVEALLYADVFDYPLTADEIHHYLMAPLPAPEAVRQALDESAWLGERVTRVNGYVTLRGREAIGDVRHGRRDSSARLWAAARQWAAVLGALPFVRMVAVTGALAMDNAPAGDDIDLLIVTAPGRVWLARALVIAVVRAARLRGVGLCPNYVLSHSALALEPWQRNLYTAHDLAQMVPLVGHRVYAEMRAANAWALDYLPQARGPLRQEGEPAVGGTAARLKRWGERWLGGRVGERLEAWERGRKLRKFAAQPRTGSAAALDAERVKGHFDDHGQAILAEYARRREQHLP
jgi:hypothetical protein